MKTTPHTTANTRPRAWVRILIVIGIFVAGVALLFIGYFLWNATHSLPSNTQQLHAAQTNPAIQVSSNGSYYAIEPTATQASSAVIIYPGAFAEPSAYIARYAELAQKGIAVFIIRSPLNFALLDVNRADRIMRENPHITHWYVAGHSLGGVAACDYAKSHQQKLSGLILLASYCNGDATQLGIPVLSISASKDGLATPQKIVDSKNSLPANTQFVVIEGGNHTLFGSFAKTQPGDNSAEITEEQAQQQIITAISGFITLKLL